MGRIIEGVWDCAYCGSTKIRGKLRVCPVCSRQRDDNIKFYLDDPTNYVSDEEAKNISHNPDWLCSYCDALNSDNEQKCHECGADRSGSEKNYFENRAEIDARRSNSLKREVPYDLVEPAEVDFTKEPPVEYAPTPSKRDVEATIELYNRMEKISEPERAPIDFGRIAKVGIAAFVMLAMIVGLVWLFIPKTVDVEVTGFLWERSINIEEYVTVERSGWSMPPDGRLLDKRYEFKEYVQVLDHYETKTRTYTEQVIDHYETVVTGHRDMGNGYFEEITSQQPVYRTETRTETYEEPVYRQESVYDWKYYYEIDIWQHLRYDISSGSDKEPYWNEQELKELQRENGRTEKYTVYVTTDKGKDKSYTFDLNTWLNLDRFDKIKIKTYFGGRAELISEGVVIGYDR